MADIVCLHAKEEIEAFCRGNPFVHIYAIGDLDEFFWPYTCWYALRADGRVRQLALLYTNCSMPVVLALAEEPIDLMRELLHGLLPLLPKRFYAHLTRSAADVLEKDYRIQAHGVFHKMALRDRQRLARVDASDAVVLTAADADALRELYEASYPGHWFVPRMLDTGYYFGIRRAETILSVAGVHVYSPIYKVAALGNIATRPEARGQGLATAVTARLSQALLHAGVAHVGLNVRADNRSAVACYEKIGFERVADYGEYTLDRR